MAPSRTTCHQHIQKRMIASNGIIVTHKTMKGRDPIHLNYPRYLTASEPRSVIATLTAQGYGLIKPLLL
ncbi:hypothetical protein QTN94_18390 [Vibrio sp. M250220]|uniref:hypothetical protein n=1 Tax=Vibrio sp. M250220 TaxID=3020894 RepID=UPI002F3E54D0